MNQIDLVAFIILFCGIVILAYPLFLLVLERATKERSSDMLLAGIILLLGVSLIIALWAVYYASTSPELLWPLAMFTLIFRFISPLIFVRSINTLRTSRSLLSNSSSFNLIEEIRQKKSSNDPYLIVFVGINGTGKTTTLAKVAHLLKNNGLTCVLACADTYRAGAIEQLIEHSNRLSLKTISQSYGSDPAAVARDAIIYSKSNNIDVVLVDTAGRMQTNQNLMDEIKKIIRVSTPDLKIFVGDALAGNDVALQAKTFSESVNFDAIILTKIDADVKGGSALSISFVTGKPILYLGNGQDYDSLKPFNVNDFISLLFDDIDQPK